MSNAWFRFYHEVLDDPKVQMMPAADFKAWVNLLCLASRNDGILPDAAAIAFALRMDETGAATLIESFLGADLIDKLNGGVNGYRYAPHGWNKRQFKSDTSTDRVKRFRATKKRSNETAPETEAETEIPEADASGDGGPEQPTKPDNDGDLFGPQPEDPLPNPEKVMFDAGLRMFAAEGTGRAKAAPMLGKWKRDHGPEAVIIALGKAQREGAVDLKSFIEGCLRNGNNRNGRNERVTADQWGPVLHELAFGQAVDPFAIDGGGSPRLAGMGGDAGY